MDTIPHQSTKYQHRKWYVYILAYPDGTVFYVGKGKGPRIHQHEKEARRDELSYNPYNCNVIRKIWREGGQVLKQKVAHFFKEEDAHNFEKDLIAFYGRGNLTNLTDGGEGTTGWHHTPESRQKLDKHLNSPEFQEKRMEAGKAIKNFKTYEGFVAPDGTIYAPVTNLSAFCKEHNLNGGCMLDLTKGKIFHHQGWTLLKSLKRTRKHQQIRTYQGTPFLSPDGVIHSDIENFPVFCLERGLRPGLMLDLEEGKVSQVNGWTCYPPKIEIREQHPAQARLYRFIAPDGTIHEIASGINTFCREQSLNKGEMIRLYHGIAKSHKGWTCFNP